MLASGVMMLLWWAVGLALTLLAWPAIAALFPFDADRGYAIARAISGVMIAYLVFIVVFAGISPNGEIAHIIALCVVGLCSTLVIADNRKWLTSNSMRSAVRIECFFALVFVICCIIRSRNPQVEGLEKFMNFGFINSVYFTPTFPPPDPWFSGKPINYYYFGHMSVATMIRLTGLPLDVGYNLAFAHVFASFASTIASLTWQMLTRLQCKGAGRVFSLSCFAGLLATFGGNFHSIAEGIIRPALATAGVMADRAYYFAESSRYIGFHPSTTDKAFVEFPGYSVIVGDLHAHVMALPLIATLHLIAFSLVRSRTDPIASWKSGGLRRKLVLAQAGLAVFVLGCDGMTNVWDLPAGILLLSFATAFKLLSTGRRLMTLLVSCAVVVASLALGVAAIEAPFWRSFEPFGGRIELVSHATPLWQLFMLYGNYAAVALTAVAIHLWTKSDVGSRASRVYLHLKMLGAFVLTLIAVPETIYLADIYGSDYARANTMFKMSYQVYVILPVIAVVCFVLVVGQARGKLLRAGLAFGGAALLAPALAYPWFGISQLLGMTPPLLRLGGLGFMAERNPDDLAVIGFLITNRPRPGSALVEASGDSYTYAGRISATTGIPTVLGWQVHEWLWRKSADLWKERADLIAKFYQSAGDAERQRFLDRFHIRYIIIGNQEHQAYPNLDQAALLRLGRVAFRSGTTVVVEVDPR